MFPFFCFLCGVAAGVLAGYLWKKKAATAGELAGWKTRLETGIDKDAATARSSVLGVVADMKTKL